MNQYNENQPEYYFGIGNEIVKEGIFERFPELIPAIGEHCWREDGKHNKLLVIGESNYFDDKDIPNSDFLDAEKWYKAEEAKLIPDNAQKKVSNWKGGRPFEKAFKIMDKVLSETGIEHEEYLLNEAAFYNYFLRPAHKTKNQSKSFKAVIQDIDKEVSGTALSAIINRINPEIVIFLSEFASTEFANFCVKKNLSFDNIVIESTSHPAYWWTTNEDNQGKAKFEQLLKKYWINR